MRARNSWRPMRRLLVTLAGFAGSCAGALAAEPTATVVEFHDRALDRYLITASAAEAAALDAAASTSGWRRTGVEWKAWANRFDAADTVPVCRFHGTPGAGPDAHFYTASASECARAKTDPQWTFDGIAFWAHPADASTASAPCRPGTTPVYRSHDPGANPLAASYRYVTDLTLHQKMAGTSTLEGIAMCAPLSSGESRADVVRFLEQATFGPTDALIGHVLAVGIPAYLAEQFAAPPTRYADYPYAPFGQQVAHCAGDANPRCFRDNYTLFLLQNEFFRNALAGDDQLRQRVAFALSQILVVSGLDINLVYGMSKYQQIFLDHAFGNFEDILTRVTLSPVMGDYLNMVNNDKPSPGINPNENYARELLQLFSIGVWELNRDGTPLRDAGGGAIPSYDQDTIEAFAHVFTGWTYPRLPGVAPRRHNPKNFLGDMYAVAGNHDTGPKSPLLDGASLRGGEPMQAELAAAIRNVFAHPNVGPFIGRQLIQKLVTGDPSPQYVARVAAAFDDNGAGLRGDMKAVIRSVLTDPEARGAVKLDPSYGKLREPVLYMTGLARALGTRSDGVFFGTQSGALGQRLFYPASVFNYYPPTYVVPGTASNGPEFAIQNTSTAINRYNFANALVYGAIAPLATLPGASGTQPDWSALAAVAGDANALLDRLDSLLLHGTMSAAARAAILPAVTAIPPGNALARAKTAFYLVATSSDYQVER